MIALLKAIPFGIFLTLVIALFMGSGSGTGGQLGIRTFDFAIADFDIRLYWSWVLFLAGTGLAWVLLLMMGD